MTESSGNGSRDENGIKMLAEENRHFFYRN